MKHKLLKKYLLPQIAATAAINNIKVLIPLINEAKIEKVPFIKIYECLLQNYLFIGFPSALTSLKTLKKLYPDKKLPPSEDMNLYHFIKQGELNCRKVYGDKFEKLIYNIKNFSPELSNWLILEGYGKVLSRPGLSFKERELCIIAVLSALKFEDQLYSHINGAVRAKSSIEDIEEVIKNLDLITTKKYSTFGMKVLKRYRKERGAS